MATGIVSVALALDGRVGLSRLFLWLAAGVWAIGAVLAAACAAGDRARFAAELGRPAALTAVAGTAVIGSRLVLLSWNAAAWPALALAVTLWALLGRPVLAHWRTPTTGASLLITVATQSLAVLTAALALRTRSAWLLYAALVPFVIGLGSYAYVMAEFDLRELLVGRGDHWITGGALAISALAAGNIAAGAGGMGVLGGGHGALEVVAVVLWGAAVAWLPALVVAEALRPRMAYDVRRWATVFPLVMYAACSFVVGNVAHLRPITSFARLWVWIGVAAWAVVCAGAAAGKFGKSADRMQSQSASSRSRAGDGRAS